MAGEQNVVWENTPETKLLVTEDNGRGVVFRIELGADWLEAKLDWLQLGSLMTRLSKAINGDD